MAVRLRKGDGVKLTKGTNLTEAMIGLGWDTNRYRGNADFDLDLVIFECNKSGRCVSEDHMVFYHNLEDPEHAIKHSGDNRTGEGDGDDETAFIKFGNIASDVERIIVVVTIYEAQKNKQNFGLVDNAYIRMVNSKNGKEILRYDLREEFSIQTSVVFGEIYRDNGGWTFKAVGDGYNKELADFCRDYGIDVM